MADGTIKIDTKIDNSGIDKGIDKFKNSLGKANSSINEHQKGLSALTIAYGNLVSQGITKAVTALGDFIKGGIEVASNLAEVQNVVDKTFEKNANVINDFSKRAMESFGLTELQAKKLSSTFGAMFKSTGLTDSKILDMSINMTKLSGDMASFYNLDHETAFNKIRSGISGRLLPLILATI